MDTDKAAAGRRSERSAVDRRLLAAGNTPGAGIRRWVRSASTSAEVGGRRVAAGCEPSLRVCLSSRVLPQLIEY